MSFLDKLYDSNYFGIGLFIVISFLVVTFLIVLFFGKKDEKKRKLEETNNMTFNNAQNTFKETSIPTQVETPVAPAMPVMPTNVTPNVVESVAPIAPTPIEPVQSINVTPVTPVIQEPTSKPVNINPIPVTPIEPVAPISYEQPVQNVTPINEVIAPINIEPIAPTINEPTPVVEEARPIVMEPTIIETPIASIQPVEIEPIQNINIEPISTPIETPTVEPIIKEEITPILPEINEEPLEITEAPVIGETYYKPIEQIEDEKIAVPNINFNALAESISAELDELEQNNSKVDVTSTEEKTPNNIEPKVEPERRQFSSVYVSEPEKPKIDLPKRIDLPTKKGE